MSDDIKVVNRGGIKLSTLLGVVFIVLKLCKVITWSWVWVLAPFWISWLIALVLLIVIIVLAVAFDIDI